MQGLMVLVVILLLALLILAVLYFTGVIGGGRGADISVDLNPASVRIQPIAPRRAGTNVYRPLR